MIKKEGESRIENWTWSTHKYLRDKKLKTRFSSPSNHTLKLHSMKHKFPSPVMAKLMANEAGNKDVTETRHHRYSFLPLIFSLPFPSFFRGSCHVAGDCLREQVEAREVERGWKKRPVSRKRAWAERIYCRRKVKLPV